MPFAKKTTTFILTMGLGLSQLTGCTDQEIATSVGAAALIGGAVLIGANTQCQGGYQNRCHNSYDYWGRVYQECNSYYDSCARVVPRGSGYNSHGHHRDSIGTNSSLGSAAGLSQLSAVAKVQSLSDSDFNLDTTSEIKLAQQFNLTQKSTNKFLAAMNEARKGNRDALLGIGLDGEDIENLSDKKFPTDQGLDRMARILDASKNNVTLLVGRLLEASKTSEFDEIQKSLMPEGSITE